MENKIYNRKVRFERGKVCPAVSPFLSTERFTQVTLWPSQVSQKPQISLKIAQNNLATTDLGCSSKSQLVTTSNYLLNAEGLAEEISFLHYDKRAGRWPLFVPVRMCSRLWCMQSHADLFIMSKYVQYVSRVPIQICYFTFLGCLSQWQKMWLL